MKIKLLIVLTVFFKIASAQNITANFAGSGSGCAPVSTNFTDQSISNNGPIISWQWTFQGGTPSFSTIQNPYNISYDTPGTYNVSLIVTNSNGDKDTSVSLACVNVYAWPSASFTYTISGTTVACTGISSPDIASHDWLFGDGSSQNTNASPVHTYTVANTYNICHRIENINGCWDTACQSIILTSINEKYLENFIIISPNPFSTQTTVSVRTFSHQAGNSIKNATLAVYNSLGQEVKLIKNISGETITFHRDNLPSGLYFIQLIQNNLTDDRSGKIVTTNKLVIIDN